MCAAEQDMFWPYHDTLFANPGNFTSSNLKRYAAALDMDTAAFDDCLDSGRYSQQVEAERAEGQAKGVSSTPTTYINDVQLVGAQDFAAFQDVIEAKLASAAQ